MKIVASREFQLNYQRLDDPVVVMARSRKLGTWYPKGTEPATESSASPRPVPASEAAGNSQEGALSGDSLAPASTGDVPRGPAAGRRAHTPDAAGPTPAPATIPSREGMDAAYQRLAKSQKG